MSGLNIESKKPLKDSAFRAVSVKAEVYDELKKISEKEKTSLATVITALLEYYRISEEKK